MLVVYRRYVDYFPRPVEPNLETRSKIAAVLKKKNDQDAYMAALKQIIAIDAAAGGERTPRTRYLAGTAAVVLAEQTFDQFAAVKLVAPIKVSLDKKKALMKIATQQFDRLLDYEVGEVTAAATFYLAEIYARFSKDLRESERPADLSALEREEYELALEDQAYPFEEKAIATYKKNLELIALGVYNEWIDKSLQRLAKFIPARYDKPEEESPVVASPDTYIFAIARPEPPAAQAAKAQETAKPAAAPEAAQAEPKQDGTPAESKADVKTAETETVQAPDSTGTKEGMQAPEPKDDGKSAAEETGQGAKPKKLAKPAAAEKEAEDQ